MLFLSVTEADEAGALDSVPTTAAIAISFSGAKPVLTCVFGPASDPRMAARSYARVVTRKSDDGGRAFRPAPKITVELAPSLRSAARSMMPATRVIVTEVSQLASGSPIAGSFDAPLRVAV